MLATVTDVGNKAVNKTNPALREFTDYLARQTTRKYTLRIPHNVCDWGVIEEGGRIHVDETSPPRK